jgi:quercetin dioxygenase-like cupin family protein
MGQGEKQDFVVTRCRADAWRVGRAGMHDRELIPAQQGGRFTAVHRRMEEGGLVQDEVHFHVVRFQMIYCYKGWVRLVYEDQGDAFILNAGDCVLQPPSIRHRVLECSPGHEAIEIASPANPATHVDDAMILPTALVRADRDFDGQRFFCHRAAGAAFEPRSLGISPPSAGAANVRVLRTGNDALSHDADLLFGFVLRGAMSVSCDGRREALVAADAFVIPAGPPFELGDVSEDLAWLAVRAPHKRRSV